MDSSIEVNIESDATTLFKSVSSALADQADKDVFAIGGKINIANPISVSKDHVKICWDLGSGSQGHKLVLPVNGDAASEIAFAQLLKDCEPATFGHGNKDVYDETYRKAGKMDEEKFCTNFSPYEHGVIDMIVQALVHNNHTDGRYRGVRAELYKLNIYSGPSGKFKSHVDTPRSKDQMGSLVVCLPYPHKGGQLVVRHMGREILFDWASDKPSVIQWAAFFSDCEHEVFEVIEGHRVTLTYNLHWTAYGPASMADHLEALDQKSLHFFAALDKLLACPTFLPQGATLGFTCTHAYPHTSKSSIGNLYHTLKGLDMVVYQALKRLTGSAQVATVLDDDRYQTWKREYEYGYSHREKPEPNDKIGNVNESNIFLGKVLDVPTLCQGYDDDELLDPEDITRCVRNDDGELPDPEDLTSCVSNYTQEEQREQVYSRQKVTWLNYSPGSQTMKELAVAFITYGNEAEVDAYYSSAVIIADLKDFYNRQLA